MHQLRALLRVLALLFAVVQATAPGLAAVADARARGESRWASGVVHVEEHGSEACPHLHPADCALCQYLAHGSGPPAASPPLAAPAKLLARGPTTRVAPAHGGDVLSLPRAPPSA